ncbi:hypothetical protein TruAng_004437 [Truncatella angustata]|nr:hypothetical protein TruAng_004437 [Truncatella angustata]
MRAATACILTAPFSLNYISTPNRRKSQSNIQGSGSFGSQPKFRERGNRSPTEQKQYTAIQRFLKWHSKVASIGPFADVIIAGTYAANNSTIRSFGNTLLQSLQTEFGISNVLFEQGLDFINTTNSSGIDGAVAAAKEARVAIVNIGSVAVQGEDSLAAKRTDGNFYSHAELHFPRLQQDLLNAVPRHWRTHYSRNNRRTGFCAG